MSPSFLALCTYTAQMPRAVILTYHDVVPSRTQSSLWFDCSVDELNQQLDWLTARGARFGTLKELAEAIERHQKLPPKTVIVTFADGYKGFCDLAVPILRRRGIPCAQFVHTAFVGSAVGRPKMNWDELIELDRSGLVTIGSQTVSHPADIRKLSPSALRLEFGASKRTLETKLGHKIDFLAYPNGKWNAMSGRMAQSCGYRLAFTEELKPTNRASSNWTIGRYVHTRYRQAWADLTRN